jgi:cytochrome c-type biogenesis protein CcmH/NrfG
MAPYSAGDFAGAADRLGQRLRTDPGDERARFYLGVSLLLTGHPDQSIEPLHRVAEESDLLSSDASWYLAVACLATGDDSRAVALLRDLAAQGGDRGDRARALLVEIEGQQKR